MYEYGYFKYKYVLHNHVHCTCTSLPPANWRLDLPLPMILLGVRACVPCMVQVPVPVMYKCFWHVSTQGILTSSKPFRSTPTVPRFTNSQFNNLIYRRWMIRGPFGAFWGIRRHNYRYVAPSGFQPGSHKNVHKNLINQNLRCSMQGENHRINIIFPRDFGYAWVHSCPEPDIWPRPSNSLGSQLGNA